MAQESQKHRFLYVIFATVETILFGGIFFGWSVMVFIMKDEGVFENLCPVEISSEQETLPIKKVSVNSTEFSRQNCMARDDMFSLVFSVDSSLLYICIAIQGLFNFKFGTRKTRILAHVQFICGALMIGFTSIGLPWLIFPGLLLIGISGYFHMLTNIQFSYLFPRNSVIVVGILNGAIDSSGGVPQIVKLGYEAGISRQISFFIIIAVYLISFINTFLFLPKMFINIPFDDTQREKKKEIGVFTTVVLNNTTKNNTSPKHSSVDTVKKPKVSLKTFVLSTNYITHVIWFSMLILRYLFYINTFNLNLEQMFEQNKDQVSHYTSAFSYFLMTSCLISPLAGFLYAKSKQRYIKCESDLRRLLMPNILPMITTSLLCIITSVLVLLDLEWTLYVNFFMFAIFRAFFFTCATGYLTALYPPKYMSPLYGGMTLVAGTFALLQYALFQWVEKAGLMQVNQVMLVIPTLSLVHPISQLIIVRQKYD